MPMSRWGFASRCFRREFWAIGWFVRPHIVHQIERSR